MPTESSPAVLPEPETLRFLLEVAEVANSSPDLDELLARIAATIRQAIDYEILAILLLNESTQELRIRYAIGHKDEVVRNVRVPVGAGITGAAAAEGRAVMVPDVRADGRYINVLDEVRSELAVPMIAKGRVVGVIDLQSRQAGGFSERQRGLLSLVASRVAAAIENARLYRSTLRQARTLATLTAISHEFSSILKLDALLRKIAELVRKLIGYDVFSILLLDERDGLLKHYLSSHFMKQVQDKKDFPLGKGIVGTAAAQARSLLVPDVTRDPRYVSCNPAVRSELAVPLVVKDRVIGVLDMESARRAFFTSRHLQTMETLAPQIAIAIENARLYEQLARDEARMERDLAAARELQESLLPACCPQLPGLEMEARYEPARELGGDLYDFIEYEAAAGPLPLDTPGAPAAVGIFTGDVSGKGAPAALYAALSHGLIRTLAQRRQPPGQVLARLNKVLCERRVEARSLALCLALLDMRTYSLEIANAGLPHPIFCRGGEILPLRVEGVPLGLLDGVEYQATVIEMRPGDTAVFYTDGISENFNAAGEEFGRHRLRELIAANCRFGAAELLQRIFDEASRWSAGRPASDDRTAVVLRRADEPQSH